MAETHADAGRMAGLRKLLRRPARLGMALNAALFGGWYVASYMPMSRAIAQDAARITAERERLALGREVEQLRLEAGRFAGHLPGPGEGDAWVPFLMGGVRQFPVKLVSLEPRTPIDVGPYKATVHRVVVEGPYPELARFLEWLEGAPRLIRIDSIRVVSKAVSGSAPGATTNEMQLMVLGVEG